MVFCDAVWDHIMLSKFEFIWHDVTNFRPHTQEIEMRTGGYMFGIVQICILLLCAMFNVQATKYVCALTNIAMQS